MGHYIDMCQFLTKLGELRIFGLQHPAPKKRAAFTGGRFASPTAEHALHDTQLPSSSDNLHAAPAQQLRCLEIELPSKHPSSAHPIHPRPSLKFIWVAGISGDAKSF